MVLSLVEMTNKMMGLGGVSPPLSAKRFLKFSLEMVPPSGRIESHFIEDGASKFNLRAPQSGIGALKLNMGSLGLEKGP